MLDLAFGSREPGEPFVAAASKTLWYDWRAPATGLFRFRLQEADSGDPFDTDFKLFTGDTLVTLELAAEKSGKEISFDAKAGARYRLRIESNVPWAQWDLAPLVLKWEPADSRPANDDIAYAQTIEGESGSFESTNEGATLERSEFLGGRAASVWYEWTAPRDGYAYFNFDGASGLNILAFAGSQIGELRLVSRLQVSSFTRFPVQGGETYRIAVAAQSADASGAGFTLSWRLGQTSPNVQYNDDFRDAGSIGASEGAEHGFLDLAGSDLGSLTVEPIGASCDRHRHTLVVLDRPPGRAIHLAPGRIERVPTHDLDGRCPGSTESCGLASGRLDPRAGRDGRYAIPVRPGAFSGHDPDRFVFDLNRNRMGGNTLQR